jgi:hypothetical protein
VVLSTDECPLRICWQFLWIALFVKVQYKKWKPADQFQFILQWFFAFSSCHLHQDVLWIFLFLILKRDDHVTILDVIIRKKVSIWPWVI